MNDTRAHVLAACAAARQTFQYLPPHQTPPVRAVELAEKWANGGSVTALEVRIAANEIKNGDQFLNYEEHLKFARDACYNAAMTVPEEI